MNLLEDFRASVHPETAQRRLDHFSSRLTAAEAAAERASVSGAAERTGALLGPDYRYRDLLRSHVAFAKAQIDAAADKDRAWRRVALEPGEPLAPEPAKISFAARVWARVTRRAA